MIQPRNDDELGGLTADECFIAHVCLAKAYGDLAQASRLMCRYTADKAAQRKMIAALEAEVTQAKAGTP